MRYGRVAVWGWFAFCLAVSGYRFADGSPLGVLMAITSGITVVVTYRELKKGNR